MEKVTETIGSLNSEQKVPCRGKEGKKKRSWNTNEKPNSASAETIRVTGRGLTTYCLSATDKHKVGIFTDL